MTIKRVTPSVAIATLVLWLYGASPARAADPLQPDPAAVLAIMERVADWQLAHLEPVESIRNAREETRSPRSWQQAAFYAGLTELAQRSPSKRFRDAVIAHGRAAQWQLGDRKYHADDHAIGQSYLWASTHGAGPEAITPLRQRFDEILAAPSRIGLRADSEPRCFERWCWCDALFMAPPVWVGLSAATGDPRYAAFAHTEFMATTDLLYDTEEHLYFRDSRFFEQRDDKGRKLFWSRGNGWVFAGLARVLAVLPPQNRTRPAYEGVFKEMAARLLTLQKSDGYWAPSLLAVGDATPAESSGTGFFVYGMAWGIEAGLLERATYEPAVRRGWRALERAVHANGMLGSVQQVSDRPEQVSPTDTQFYGVGAFLLAGSAAHDLYQPGVNYVRLADIVVNRNWKLEPGEHVVVFADPALDRGMGEPLRHAIRKAGGVVEEIAAPTAASVSAMTPADRAARDEQWKAIFARSSAAIWLPSDVRAMEDRPFEHLVEASKVRSIHFHWFLPPDATDVPVVEKMYETAILVPPEIIARRMAKVEFSMRGKRVHVTAPNGTDFTFVIPATARVHRNTGDASVAKVSNARSVRDREEELPASVLRTTDLDSATGVFVGYTNFDTRSPVLKATFANGRATRLESVRGADEIVKEWHAASGAKDLPGEFVVATNPALAAVLPSGFMPYYGYGAGIVRLAIGDNWESGGTNRSSNGELLMFLPDATVEAGGVTIIRNGEYTAGF